MRRWPQRRRRLEFERQPIPEAPIIVWFRRDLRLADHAALIAAEAAGAPILPLYVLDDETPGRFRAGGASRWWLHSSLEALDGALAKLGRSLVLRGGPAPSALDALLAETGATAIFATRGYEPWEAKLEQDIAKLCATRGAELPLVPGSGAVRARGNPHQGRQAVSRVHAVLEGLPRRAASPRAASRA
jgi:deoxyribodipyrimidine photolyase